MTTVREGGTVILGTGPAGLTAGYRLAQAGEKPVLIERGKRAGGLMQSIHRGDFILDIGRKQMYSRIPEIDQLWTELLGDDYIAYERGMKEGDMHPVITAMNTLGFEASTFGNHEFNYGLDFLMKSIAGASFPIVSANVAKGTLGANPRAHTTLVKPYVILEKRSGMVRATNIQLKSVSLALCHRRS